MDDRRLRVLAVLPRSQHVLPDPSRRGEQCCCQPGGSAAFASSSVSPSLSRPSNGTVSCSPRPNRSLPGRPRPHLNVVRSPPLLRYLVVVTVVIILMLPPLLPKWRKPIQPRYLIGGTRLASEVNTSGAHPISILGK